MRQTSFAFLSVFLTGLALAGIGQRVTAQERAHPVGDVRSGTCNPALTISAGAGVNHFSFCLSNEGNVVHLRGPWGSDHLQAAAGNTGLEGYRLCTSAGDYWDYGSWGNSGFGPATVVQPKGAGKLPITITRNTLNGQWQLVQQYAFDKTERDMTITMKLKKLSTPIGSTVYLSRWVDYNMDQSWQHDVGDKSFDAIYARQSTASSLVALTFANGHFTDVGVFPFGSSDCASFGSTFPMGPADVSGRVSYFFFGGFNINQTRTVKFKYAVH